MDGVQDVAVIESFLAFADHFNVELYDWQRDAFGEACARVDGRFKYRLAGISVPRGNGKSWGGAVVGLWRLLCAKPPTDLLSVALDTDGAKVVLGHAKRIVRECPALRRAVRVKTDALEVPATGSRWSIASREHEASRGRHPDAVIYDEVGWARDQELFSSLLAGQASVEDPFMLVISTVGRRQAGPLWTVKTLAEGGDESVLWWHSSENLSPKVTQKFLDRQRRILLPAQFAREHQNAWVDAADSFTTAAEVDAAMGRDAWTERIEGEPGESYVCFVDIGAVHDPAVVAVGHEADGIAYIDKLVSFYGNREEPVSLSAVEDCLKSLAQSFKLVRIKVESWQGLSSVQTLSRLGLPVELFAPTAKTNSDEWPVLAQRLSARTIVLPPHARLREELLNLCVEMGPTGVRVTDRGKVHQDHAVAVRGVVAQLATPLGAGIIQARNLSPTPLRVGLNLTSEDPLAAAADDYENEAALWRLKGERPPWPSDGW